MANRKRIEQDSRNLLFRNFVHSVDILQPKCFLIENVTGLSSENIKLRSKDQPITKVIENYFKTIGYQIKFISFKAEAFGIPQFRRRILIIGTNIEKKKKKLLNGEIGNLKGDYLTYDDLQKIKSNLVKLKKKLSNNQALAQLLS